MNKILNKFLVILLSVGLFCGCSHKSGDKVFDEAEASNIEMYQWKAQRCKYFADAGKLADSIWIIKTAPRRYRHIDHISQLEQSRIDQLKCSIANGSKFLSIEDVLVISDILEQQVIVHGGIREKLTFGATNDKPPIQIQYHPMAYKIGYYTPFAKTLRDMKISGKVETLYSSILIQSQKQLTIEELMEAHAQYIEDNRLFIANRLEFDKAVRNVPEIFMYSWPVKSFEYYPPFCTGESSEELYPYETLY